MQSSKRTGDENIAILRRGIIKATHRLLPGLAETDVRFRAFVVAKAAKRVGRRDGQAGIVRVTGYSPFFVERAVAFLRDLHTNKKIHAWIDASW